MASIAGHAIATVLATAEIDGFRLFCLIFFGRKCTTFMTAIAKWLSSTLAAGAIPVAFASFNIDSVGRFLGDMGFIFGHNISVPQK